MNEHSQRLARNLALLQKKEREDRRTRRSPAQRAASMLVSDLVAARRAAGLTQEEVAARMWNREERCLAP